MQTTFRQPAQIWAHLTQPHSRVTDIEQRRQSHLLNLTILALIGASTIVNVISYLQDTAADRFPLESSFLTPFNLVLLGVYAANLRGYFRASAYISIAAGYLLIAAFATQEYNVLIYSAILILLSAMFLPNRATQGIAVLLFLTVIGFVFYLEGEPDTITPLFVSNFLTIALPVALLYVWHRQQIETERRANLEAANQRLRESEAMLEIRVKERTAELEDAKAQTEAALTKAVEADRLKSQFLASMSHELRTPLNAILTFNELMQMGTFGPVNEEQVDYLGKSLQSGRHLLSLINDVLDITKIQSGMMKLFVEDGFDVTTEVQAVAETAKRLLGGKPVEIVLDVDTEISPLTCDKRRLRQVMLNLMSNAVKFTETGTITLSVKQQTDHLLFAVMDTGPGITADQHDMIFEPFVQTVDGIKHAGGSGLGLPISKRIVESHGGQLWVESTPDDGSDFFFTLPLQSILESGEQEMMAHA
jgi:signal transduction histidine kinase